MGGLVKVVATALVLAAARRAAADDGVLNGVATGDLMSADDALPTLSTRDRPDSWQERARSKQLLYASEWPTDVSTEPPALSAQLARSWLDGGALERMSRSYSSSEQSAGGPGRASQCKLFSSDPERAICPGDFGTTVKCSLCLQKPENQIKLKLSEPTSSAVLASCSTFVARLAGLICCGCVCARACARQLLQRRRAVFLQPRTEIVGSVLDGSHGRVWTEASERPRAQSVGHVPGFC